MDEVLHTDHVCIGELQSMSGVVHVQVRFAKTFRRFVDFLRTKTHTLNQLGGSGKDQRLFW